MANGRTDGRTVQGKRGIGSGTKSHTTSTKKPAKPVSMTKGAC